MIQYFSFMILILCLFTGCDKAYGPLIRNDLGENIEINVYFINGDIITAQERRYCMSTFLGRGDRTIDKIDKIVISKKGETLHALNAEQVKKMIDIQEKHYGYSIWSISRDGELKFITGEDAKKCGSSGL